MLFSRSPSASYLAALLAMAGLAGCMDAPPPDACGPQHLAPLSETPSFAVVASDYSSSAIGLLDSDGAVISQAWVDSGTVAPTIVAALSGDLALPSEPIGACALTVIDRFGTDVVSILDTCADEPIRSQIDVGSAFGSNPHDVLRVDEDTLWVSRFGRNPNETTDPLMRGNDIAVIRDNRVAARIDLSSGDTAGTDARPDRMVRLTHPSGVARVVVGLARLSLDFMETAGGALAVIDEETLAVQIHALEGLSLCSELDRIGEVVVATCGGPAFSDEQARRAEAGVVALRLTETGELEELHRWAAADHPADPVPSGPTIALSEGRWISVAWGDLGTGVPDRVLWLEGGETARVLYEAAPFTVGDGVFDPAADLVLIPDADAGTIRRFRADGSERDPVGMTDCLGLPPREVRRIAFP